MVETVADATEMGTLTAELDVNRMPGSMEA